MKFSEATTVTVQSPGHRGPLTHTTRSGWWLVVAMAATTYMAMLDMTVVTVALPVMTDDFGVTPAVSEWLVLAYLLPLVGLSLPAGRWVDRAPWRTCLLVSILGFAGSSVLVATSQSAAAAIISRGIQGAFAALLFALAPAVASRAVAPTARGRAMSVIATIGPLGAISGYGAGALIVDSLGWSWAFYLNVPIAAASTAVVLAVMPAGRARLRPPSRDMGAEAALLLLAAGALLLGLSLAAAGDLAWLALSLAAILPLAIWTRGGPGRQATQRLGVPALRRPHLSLLLESAAFGGATFALPFLLTIGSRESARAAGLTLLALPLASIAGSLVGGVLADRLTARFPAVLGAVVLAAGLAVLVLANPSWAPADFLWGITVAGAGAGCFAGANQAIAMTAAAPGQAASTGASTNVARQLGFAVGPAATTGIWALRDYAMEGLSAALALAVLASLGAAVVIARAGTPDGDGAHPAGRLPAGLPPAEPPQQHRHHQTP
ncbi:MAG: MFS transporter [Intrasporangium sp.]|nr:MFS transporter [Intrasporangium sp.]